MTRETPTVTAGTRVAVRLRLLDPGERAPGLPPETAALPYEAIVRGVLVEDAALGEEATVRTAIGRRVAGRLETIEPADTHTFGRPAPALVAMTESIADLQREQR
jgi:hypothetical protein